MSARYAVYYAPPPGSPLHVFGTRWLGRDHATGEALPQSPVPGFTPERVREITAFARHYGFHATLKAPFELAPMESESALFAAALQFAASERPLKCPPLAVTPLSGWIALTFSAPAPELDALAARCVRAFDPFRAPPSAADLARRRAGRLTPRQERYLLEWGYPGVFEEFWFHMTLAGSLKDDEQARLLKVLQEQAAHLTREPLTVDAIAIYRQPARPEPFVLRARFPFGGA